MSGYYECPECKGTMFLDEELNKKEDASAQWIVCEDCGFSAIL